MWEVREDEPEYAELCLPYWWDPIIDTDFDWPDWEWKDGLSIYIEFKADNCVLTIINNDDYYPVEILLIDYSDFY